MAHCEVCGTEMVQGRGPARRTCSGACRQAAHRRRQTAEVTALRQAAAQPGPAPSARPTVSPPVPDDTPAGRIRAAGAALAAAAGHAAAAAEEGACRDASLAALRRHYDDLVAAVCAAMQAEPSRNEPAPVTGPPRAAAPATASPEPEPSRDKPARPLPTPTADVTDSGTAPQPGRRRPARPAASAALSSRNELASTAAPAVTALPTWDTSAIKPVPQKLPKKKAEAVLDAAELVRAPDYRDSHMWILRSGDTLIGYVMPSYGGASRSGRNGWTSSMGDRGPRCHSRDGAKVDLAARWLRVVTAAPKRTLTGGR